MSVSPTAWAILKTNILLSFYNLALTKDPRFLAGPGSLGLLVIMSNL